VLKPCPCGVAEVERQILDDEKINHRSCGLASEPIVLKPYTGVGVPVIPWHVGRSAEVRRELQVADALAKGPWTSLVRRPVAVAVVVTVVAPPTSKIVVAA
jgi:hypothetical protein